MEEVELNYFAYKFVNGIGFWFGTLNYPEHKRKDFVIYILFIQLAWVKQITSEQESNDFIEKH